jgi:hypothetical protein
LDSTNRPCLLRDRITQRNADSGSRENIYPEPLRIAESVIGAFHFGKHDVAFATTAATAGRFCPPKDEVWDARTPGLVVLSHHFAYGCQRPAVKTAYELTEILVFKVPVQTYGASSALPLTFVYFS